MKEVTDYEGQREVWADDLEGENSISAIADSFLQKKTILEKRISAISS